MVEPTDQDIAEALRLAGLPGSAATLRDFKTVCVADEEPTHLAQSVRAHARTIAKLRIATEDAELLNAICDECWDLRCFAVPTGGDDADVAWRVVGHWMAEPRERVIAEEFNHDPRVAIRAAVAQIKEANHG